MNDRVDVLLELGGFLKMLMKHFMSSANLSTRQASIPEEILFMCTKNIKGPQILPLGNPRYNW